MNRFIEIDGEKHTFKDCYHCPMNYEDDETRDMYCMHPKGRRICATFYEYLDENGDWIEGWFPKGCPAREVKE